MVRKILIFSLAYYPHFVGGAEIAVKEITDRISPHEYEFHMVTLRLDKALPKVEKIGNVIVHRIGLSVDNPSQESLIRFPLYLLKVFYAPLACWKALRLHRTEHFDALWSMMSYMGFPAVFFKFFNPNIPMILTLQEGDTIDHVANRLRIKILSPFYKSIFKKADIVQVISHFLGSFARSMGYVGKIEIIPNGVDAKHFGQIYSEEELFILKQKFNKREEDIFLITTSRLVEKNAVGDVIHSLRFLPENVRFLVLGQGPEEVNLRKLVHDLDLDKRVKFLGFVSHEDIPKYLKISDIFIRPSLSEGFGNSFVEAMATHIPVIATPIGGIVDFLFDPDETPDREPTGLFCKVRNPRDIARQVARLLENPALRQQIIISADKMVRQKYDWDIVAEDMKERVFNRMAHDV